MNLLQSVFLGIVQGITEFLPVSSSGHLAIMKNVFRIETGDSSLFDILLHVGTLFVVFYVYRRDIWQMILSFFSMCSDLWRNIGIRRNNQGAITKTPLKNVVSTNYRKFVLLILVSTIPTGIIGVLAKKLISDASHSLLVVGICLLITAVLLMLCDRVSAGAKIPQDVTYREALIIGIAQGFATLPGISRSGTTIAACLLLGLDRGFAVKYSFILSIPAILGAAVLEIGDIFAEGAGAVQFLIYLAGMVTAALVGFGCIRAMLAALRRRKFRYFAFYCIAIGVFAIAANFLI